MRERKTQPKNFRTTASSRSLRGVNYGFMRVPYCAKHRLAEKPHSTTLSLDQLLPKLNTLLALKTGYCLQTLHLSPLRTRLPPSKTHLSLLGTLSEYCSNPLETKTKDKKPVAVKKQEWSDLSKTTQVHMVSSRWLKTRKQYLKRLSETSKTPPQTTTLPSAEPGKDTPRNTQLNDPELSVMVTEITTKTKLGKTGEGETPEKPKQKAYRSKNQKRNRKPSSEQNCHFSFGDIVSWANNHNVTLMCYMTPYMAVPSKLKEWTELTCEKDKLYNVFQ
ncbi:hypothetical protein ACFE04_004059 [Oxalis oulophora]